MAPTVLEDGQASLRASRAIVIEQAGTLCTSMRIGSKILQPIDTA